MLHTPLQEFIRFKTEVQVSHVLGPEGDPGGASLLAGPPAIPYGAGLRLVLSLLFLLLSVGFCRQEEEIMQCCSENIMTCAVFKPPSP